MQVCKIGIAWVGKAHSLLAFTGHRWCLPAFTGHLSLLLVATPIVSQAPENDAYRGNLQSNLDAEGLLKLKLNAELQEEVRRVWRDGGGGDPLTNGFVLVRC